MDDNYGFFFWLSVLADIAQLDNWRLNNIQVDNDTILKHLETQDDKYLSKIIEQNENIIDLLKKGG